LQQTAVEENVMTNRAPQEHDHLDLDPPVQRFPDPPNQGWGGRIWSFAWLGVLLVVIGVLFAMAEWPQNTAKGPNAGAPSTVGQGGAPRPATGQ
jgi:hypothetical protein